MNRFRKTSNVLVLVLMLIALWVFVGKSNDKGMWLPIALYWAVLTIKNLCDWCSLKKQEEESDFDEQ